MGDEVDDQGLIRRYLMGNLDEEETTKVELRALTNDDYARLVDISESELVDEYAEGSLSPEERQQFERVFFASPERKHQVNFALALRKYVAHHSPKATQSVAGGTEAEDSLPALLRTAPDVAKPANLASPAFPGTTSSSSFAAWLSSQWTVGRIALAAALLLTVTSALLLVRVRRVQNELDRFRADSVSGPDQTALEKQLKNERDRNNALEQQLQAQQQERTRLQDEISRRQNGTDGSGHQANQQTGTRTALILSPTLFRGGGKTQTLSFTSGTEPPPLELILGEGVHHGRYTAVLKANQGERVSVPGVFRSEPGRGSRGARSVTVQLPARLLKNGDYRLFLSGQRSGTGGGAGPGDQLTANGTEAQETERSQNQVFTYTFRVSIK